MSNEITEESFNTPEPSLNDGKFTSEVQKRNSSKKFVILGLIFLVLMMAVIGAFYIGKSKLDEWKAERAAAQLEKKNAAKTSVDRRDRDFITDLFGPMETEAAPGTPAPVSTPPVILPQTFSQPAPTVEAPPIPILNQPKTSAPQQVQQSAPIPFFDYPEDTKKIGFNSIQDYARSEAEKSKPTNTVQATAANLGDRSFVLARGAFVPCILETQLFSNIPGQASCVIPDNVYSDDGSRLLVPRGSSVVGTYGNSMQVGDSRIAVVWERIKTNDGYVIDVESGAADGVGTMGVGGYIDNRWPERIGAALLLSFIDDAVDIAIAEQQSDGGTRYGDSTSRSTKTLAEKVLDSTINIKPTLSVNRGARLMIYVSKDLWFDDVYGG